AVAESGRVLAVHGRVLPSTLHNVRLVADVVLPDAVNEVRVEGESQIPQRAGKIHRVWLEPNNPPAFPDVIQAILAADMIVIGPGSLYTSILPNLLVPDLMEAIRASRAFKVYLCNVATQPGETQGFNCGDHVRVLEDHIGGRLFDVIVANQRCEGKLPEGIQWVEVEEGLAEKYSVRGADLIDAVHPWRHDSHKLAQEVMELFQERTGPLVE
ncbi:MAG TPA: gluconeogenesis factor YvcK family protein, partial [Anaerolineales bacterium]